MWIRSEARSEYNTKKIKRRRLKRRRSRHRDYVFGEFYTKKAAAAAAPPPTITSTARSLVAIKVPYAGNQRSRKTTKKEAKKI